MTSRSSRRAEERALSIDRFADAYCRHCWPVEGPGDLQLAPFVVLAGEGTLFAARDHTWHMSIAERLAAVAWWEQLVGAGGEGMVVEPSGSIVTGERGLIQPGIKCRGPEYLRIIYGPEYLASHNLERLRERNIGKKRSLAQREFALGIESLEPPTLNGWRRSRRYMSLDD